MRTLRVAANALCVWCATFNVMFAAKNGLPFPWVSAIFGALSIMLLALEVRNGRRHNDSGSDDSSGPTGSEGSA